MTPSALRSCAVLLALAPSCGRSVEATPRDAGAPPAPAASARPVDAAADVVDHHATKFVLGPLPDNAPFEGSVTLQVALTTEPDLPPAKYTFFMKGKKVRWDLFTEGGRGVSTGFRLYDGAQRKFFTFLEQPVVYTTDVSALLGDAGSSRPFKFAPFAPEPNGAVFGIPCDRMQTADEKYEYDVCLASGLPTLPLSVLGKNMEVAVPFSAALERRGQFPVSVIVRPRGAAKGPRPWIAILKVLSVERGRVPDAAFDLPAYPFQPSPTLAPLRRAR